MKQLDKRKLAVKRGLHEKDFKPLILVRKILTENYPIALFFCNPSFHGVNTKSHVEKLKKAKAPKKFRLFVRLEIFNGRMILHLG